MAFTAESPPAQGHRPVVLNAVPVTGPTFPSITMDQLISTSLLSVGIAYIEQGENHGTTMILDGVSYSAFIHLCRVILSRMMNPSVVSLQSDSFWSRRVPLFGTYVSRRLLMPIVFPLQC